jgi:hypothetical protein
MTDSPKEFRVLCSRLELDSYGALTLNGQHMILLPRHFFRDILDQVSAVAGPEAFRRIFHRAGHDGALTFCRRFQEYHGCTPREAVDGYLKEMSLRGWGQFTITRLDAEAGLLEVSLRGSALAAEKEGSSGHVIWEGAMLGVMAFLQENLATPSKRPASVKGEEIVAEDSGKPAFRIVVSRE